MKNYITMLLVVIGLIPIATRVEAQPSNLIINVRPPSQYFFSGTASYSDTTNKACPTANLSGYYYPSNFIGLTRWQFAPEIISGTNTIIKLKFLTTNSATVVAGFWRLVLYTNDTANACYDSGETIFLGSVPAANTNVQTVLITNNFSPLVMSNKNNITLGTVYYKNGSVVGSWYSSWLVGGSIQFP